MTLDLPWAPSMNHYWRSIVIKGRPRLLVSRDGHAYQQAVAHAVMLQRVRKGLTSRLHLAIEARPPDRRARDLDNLLKPSLDALTKAGVWLDDSQIDRIVIVRGPVVKGGQMLVSIVEAA